MSREYRLKYYPPDSLDECQENIDTFFYFMYNRHMIWINRFIKKLPRDEWTKDPILKVTKYTNVYRELDRGTVWYLDKIMSPYQNKIIDFKTLLWWTIIYRLCNRIETFEEVGLPDWREYNNENLHNDFFLKMDAISDRGLAVMTSAHLTCPTPAGHTKIEGYIAAINDLHKKLDDITERIPKAKYPDEVFNILREVFCVGNFIAYEVWCDLSYCQAIPFSLDDWANVGPGAKEGIRMLYPSTKGNKNIYNKMVQLRDEQEIHFKRLHIDFPFYERFTKGHLSLRSCEHSLCEYQKFWLQKRNLGKQRMIFNENSNRIVEKEGRRYKVILDDFGEHIKYVEV